MSLYDQIPLNPVETAPELNDIIVLIQPPVPNRMPRFARTYRNRDGWAYIPSYDWPDIIGWVEIDDLKNLIS